MNSVFVPYVLPILVTIFITFLSISILYRTAEDLGLVATPGEHRAHRFATPTVGGIGIFVGFAFGVLLVPQMHFIRLNWLLVGALLVMVIGVLDDFRPMSVTKRFGVQLLAAMIMTQLGDNLIITLGKLVSDTELYTHTWAVPLTWFAVIGVINAVNMSDGVDGLAGSQLIIVLVPLTALYWWGGMKNEAMIPLLLVTAIIVFLLWNFRFPGRQRALIFLGDGGSMWLGYVLAWLLIDIAEPPKQVLKPVTVLWLFAVPMIDTVTVMLRRVIAGRSPFSPDRTHIHHLLMRFDWPEGWIPLISGAIAVFCISFGLLGEVMGIPERWMFFMFLLLFLTYFALSYWVFDWRFKEE